MSKGKTSTVSAEPQRVALIDLFQRYGRQHPSVIPGDQPCHRPVDRYPGGGRSENSRLYPAGN
jgi:hypothetical protein